MKYMLLFPTLLLTLVFAAPVFAADDDVPPPPAVTESTANTNEAPDVMESAPNIHDELKQPDSSTAVDIRSYQRKDGAKITEYGVRGKIFKIKVEPGNGMPAYYLYPDPQGQFVRRLPGGATGITPPSWILKEF